jgi:iron complex transport system ATP-binding protein
VTAANTISCRAVTFSYNGREVLRDVDLEVGAGEWVAVIGPNGAGKSTLLRVLAGGLDATGEVRLGGRTVDGLSRREIARLVAVVPQQPVIPNGMRVLDYALLGRTPYLPFWAGEGAADVRRVQGVLQRLDIDKFAGRTLGRLSGGELQRVVLARALAQDAGVLLLDEPTTALDIGHQQQVLELVDGLRRERGLAVVSAIHDLTLAAQYADRLVLLDNGEVAATGSAEEVLTAPALSARYGAPVTILRDPSGGLVVAPRRSRVGLVDDVEQRPDGEGHDPAADGDRQVLQP